MKRNIRKAKAKVKCNCWLTALQLANKGEVYRVAAANRGALTPMDWGDRVLLIREPTLTHPQADRLVVDTSLPPPALHTKIGEWLQKWGLQQQGDTLAGLKCSRWDAKDRRKRQENIS